MQNNRPIAFYSRKINKAQSNYTTTECELLTIEEMLKEFRNILLGQKIIVYTDHQNLTYKVFNTECIMCWHLICKEYGPELKYVKGEHNIVADALSCLGLEPPLPTENDPIVLDYPESRNLAEAFQLDDNDLVEPTFPLAFKEIQAKQ